MNKIIYLNGKKSVEIEYINKEADTVYIDGIAKDFAVETTSEAKEKFAQSLKRSKYAEFLNSQFENLILLTGAGSSYGIGKTVNENGEDIERKGRLLTHLWDDVCEAISEEKLNKLCEIVKYTDKISDGSGYVKNLEKLLSLANVAKNYVKDPNVDNPISIENIITEIEKIIKQNCTLTLPSNSPHSELLTKITKRKVTLPRVKVFTLNYDTLFEQAGREKNFTMIDGFSFSQPRVFSGRNFDLDIVSRNSSRVKEEDNFVQKVFHIYKPHGSVDWTREGSSIIQREFVQNPLMIYPKDSKYESSYEQPFFEMMSRFQSCVRSENVLLICIGFSFNDKHIVTAISEALEQNPSFQLMVVNKGIDSNSSNFKPIFEAGKRYNNIFLVDEEFADFAIYFPDLKSYNQENTKRIILTLPDESKSI
ncbi:SIR2 family protein [Pedobacter sp. CFBP9032]|uniref:SIR2 family protein n=1 Tax=Pedobacter sp. CFBP9032 TaxID=3096539 RepID=UPI002A6B3EBB|nr:SIR2 family protein [Pedobacter sp. CFBP9032]MDY0905623.1 SIR2 family protein [Pedobacter sp. CFBP9032]